MGFLANSWEEASRRLTGILAPQLAAGEELVGVVHAQQPKLFSAELFAIGVTPRRLLVQPIDRKFAPVGAALSIGRDEVLDASIWGWRGGAGAWLSSAGDQQLRFRAAGRKFRLMVLGGNRLEDALSGPTQRRGLEALIEFLLAAKR